MTKPRLSAAAIHDIREIRIYTKTGFGPAAARSYLDRLTAMLDRLVERSKIGRSDDDLRPGLRSFAYRSHRISYRLADETIDVVRVLHQAQDIAVQWDVE